jgi:hypothetical protein
VSITFFDLYLASRFTNVKSISRAGRAKDEVARAPYYLKADQHRQSGKKCQSDETKQSQERNRGQCRSEAEASDPAAGEHRLAQKGKDIHRYGSVAAQLRSSVERQMPSSISNFDIERSLHRLLLR